MSTMRNTVSLITSIAIVAVALSGCASPETLEQAGSSTVLPLAEVWAEDFGAITGTAVNVGGGGSGKGASGLCDGSLHLGDMSRAMKDSEREECIAAGVTPLEWQVAFDGLSVVVAKSNSFAKDMDTQMLHDIFTGTYTTWDETGIDGATGTIELCIPDNESGTYEYFFEEIIEEHGSEAFASNAQQSADDNVLVNCIAGSDNAIGFFGFAYVKANVDKIKTVAVEGVQPTLDTIRDGSYTPLSRPLYIYTATDMTEATHDYIHYVLTDGQAHVETVGYVPISGAVQRAMLDQLGE